LDLLNRAENKNQPNIGGRYVQCSL
jgi:hypothetical protein